MSDAYTSRIVGTATIEQLDRVVTPAPLSVSVTMAQARIAMSRAGITEAMVEAAIDAMPAGQAKTEANIWWRNSNAVVRDHPVVAQLGPALGLTSAQVDALFAAAAGLQ